MTFLKTSGAIFLIILMSYHSRLSASMLTIEPGTGIGQVNNGILKFDFFPGHFFPTRISTASGRQLPKFNFLDRITLLSNNSLWYFNLERYAELTLLCDNNDLLIIELRGTCCRDSQTVLPDYVRATYTYYIRRNDPKIEVKLHLRRDSETAAEVRFFHPSWTGADFGRIKSFNQTEPQVFEPQNGKAKLWTASPEMTVENNFVRLKINGRVSAYVNGTGQHHFLLCEIRERWTTRELELKITFSITEIINQN